jgi:amidophosphoribosyltransferase
MICGLTGDANSFAFRDPWGIRSAHYYQDDEIVVLASERAVIQTALNVSEADVHELPAGQAMVITNAGKVEFHQIRPAMPEVHPCSFERIYFSRGSDANIYQERKTLGKQLVAPILKAIDNDLKNTVFSFIPNTAEVAFFGMMEGFDAHLTQIKKNKIRPGITADELDKILSMRIRQEKVAIKDIKLRTFIAEGADRDELATHVYDITYGSIKAGVDNLVIIDDSIVRGTTLQQSILRILDRLGPKKIVIVSSSPQVRYPDCYGIDMSSMNEFIAFRAAIALLKERGMEGLIHEVYELCKAQEDQPKEAVVNYVKRIYEPFSDEVISAKIVQLLKPAGTRAEVELVYQKVEGLHKACPVHNGDWYFTGNYPTMGGNKAVNKAYMEYYIKSNEKRGD